MAGNKKQISNAICGDDGCFFAVENQIRKLNSKIGLENRNLNNIPWVYIDIIKNYNNVLN